MTPRPDGGLAQGSSRAAPSYRLSEGLRGVEGANRSRFDESMFRGNSVIATEKISIPEELGEKKF
jgi:hypothetical protein